MIIIPDEFKVHKKKYDKHTRKNIAKRRSKEKNRRSVNKEKK